MAVDVRERTRRAEGLEQLDRPQRRVVRLGDAAGTPEELRQAPEGIPLLARPPERPPERGFLLERGDTFVVQVRGIARARPRGEQLAACLGRQFVAEAKRASVLRGSLAIRAAPTGRDGPRPAHIAAPPRRRRRPRHDGRAARSRVPPSADPPALRAPSRGAATGEQAGSIPPLRAVRAHVGTRRSRPRPAASQPRRIRRASWRPSSPISPSSHVSTCGGTIATESSRPRADGPRRAARASTTSRTVSGT